MILHLVAFTWREGVTTDDVVALADALRDMADAIPEVRSYACGENLRLRPGGADFGVAAVVADADALAAYLDSAAHADVQERFIGRMAATRVAVQLEVGADARV